MQVWKLDHKESWMLKSWCFWTVVLEKTFESPLDYKEIKTVNPKWNQSWICIGRTDAKVEALILWPPDVKSQLIGKDWCWEKLKAKGEGGDRGWDWLDGITNSMDMNLSNLQEIVEDRRAWGAAVHRIAKCWTQLNNSKLIISQSPLVI